MKVAIRPADDADRLPLALLFAAVAEERDGIAAEPPVDVERRAVAWDLDRTLVASAADEVVGVFGFVEEGRRIKHMRRANGELWDLVEMGLLL